MDKRAPEKKQRLLAALDKGMTMIHLDARRPGVLVPDHLSSQGHLLLNLSYRFDPPDLSVGEWGIRSTLTFGGKRFTIAVPWSALYAITSHVTREFWMYPDDMPLELMEQAQVKGLAPSDVPADRPQGILREVVVEEGEEPVDSPSEETPKPVSRGHLRLVK